MTFGLVDPAGHTLPLRGSPSSRTLWRTVTGTIEIAATGKQKQGDEGGSEYYEGKRQCQLSSDAYWSPDSTLGSPHSPYCCMGRSPEGRCNHMSWVSWFSPHSTSRRGRRTQRQVWSSTCPWGSPRRRGPSRSAQRNKRKGGGIMEERAISSVGYRLDLRPL